MQPKRQGLRTSLGLPKRVTAAVVMILALVLAGSVRAGAGYLGPGDEQLPGGEYFDRVVFNGNAGDQLLIGLSSTQFDAYVIIVDAAGNSVAYQDDADGLGLNVSLTLTLPATGQYTVIITSALPGETGPYGFALSAAGQPAAPAPSGQQQPPVTPALPGQVAAARTVSGTVLDTSGQPIAGARS